jgi:7-carboxy-7-deazaguanine synthase
MLKVTELFFAHQGEGKYIGVPSIFVRLFGCNFRCRNFGRNKSDTSPNQDVSNVIANINQYKILNDLPLVSTGCDSYVAVYPEFKHFNKEYNATDLFVEITNLIMSNRQHQFANSIFDTHIVFTGGEPLLWQQQLVDLLYNLFSNGFKNITFETNGTQLINDTLTFI